MAAPTAKTTVFGACRVVVVAVCARVVRGRAWRCSLSTTRPGVPLCAADSRPAGADARWCALPSRGSQPRI